MPKTINDLTWRYLKENGIKIAFLADYINEDPTILSKWLRGNYNMKPESIAKAHEFLHNSHKPIENMLKNGEV